MSNFFTTPASQRKRKRPETSTNTSSKRRTFSSTTASKSTPKQSRHQTRDESISDTGSDGSADETAADNAYESESDGSSGEEDETADERRLRLAQRYLDNIKEEVNHDPYAFDAADVDRDLIAERLREDVADTKGKLHRFISDERDWQHAEQAYFSADQNGVTAVTVIAQHVFTASPDGSIAKWEIASRVLEREKVDRPSNITPRKRPKLLKRFKPPRNAKEHYKGHTSSILCMAASSSGKFLVTGGTDRKLVVWDPVKLKPIKCFTHHRDAVLGLTFRRNTHTLYSASADRTCKVWGLDDMAYIQTLFGHQDHVVDVAGLADERFVSVGARDRTARLFKVVEEQQLVFRGGGSGGASKSSRSANGDVNGIKESPKFEEGSMDRVAIIDEETFVTASDNGSLSLWSVLRKKPIFSVPLAHGTDAQSTLEEAYAEDVDSKTSRNRPGREKPRWITALTSIPLADIILSGSWDGVVRVWRVTKDRRRLESIGAIGSDGQLSQAEISPDRNHKAIDKSGQPRLIKGIINDLAISERGDKGKDGLCVVAAVSRSHRFGKWHATKGSGSRNGAVIFEVSLNAMSKDDGAIAGGEWGGLDDS